MTTCIETITPNQLTNFLEQSIKETVTDYNLDEKHNPIISYISKLTKFQSETDNFHQVEWEKTCKVYLEQFLNASNALEVTNLDI